MFAYNEEDCRNVRESDGASRCPSKIMGWFDLEQSEAPTTYRVRAMKEYGAFCTQCGYDKDPKMLDVDHIDSNRKNNALENLQVLCVWCHAAKTRGVKWHKWFCKGFEED